MEYKRLSGNTDSVQLDGGALTTHSLIGKLVLKLKAAFGREGVIPEEVGFWVTWKNTTKPGRWGGVSFVSRRKSLKTGKPKHS